MAKIKNTAGKPEDETVTRSIRVRKDSDTAVREIAAHRRTSAAEVYRHLTEKGLRCLQEGTFDKSLVSILGEMKQKTERNERISKILLEMLYRSAAHQRSMWTVIIDITSGQKPDSERAEKVGKKYAEDELKKEINRVLKGEDKLSATIRNDMPASELE